jgi:hypothetical protein
MKRINKRVARGLYNEGIAILVLPNKTNANNAWNIGMEANKAELEKKELDADFDRLINAYEHYNCNAELGSYSAFYINE